MSFYIALTVTLYLTHSLSAERDTHRAREWIDSSIHHTRSRALELMQCCTDTSSRSIALIVPLPALYLHPNKPLLFRLLDLSQTLEVSLDRGLIASFYIVGLLESTDYLARRTITGYSCTMRGTGASTSTNAIALQARSLRSAIGVLEACARLRTYRRSTGRASSAASRIKNLRRQSAVSICDCRKRIRA